MITDSIMGTKRGDNETERVREEGYEGAKGKRKREAEE